MLDGVLFFNVAEPPDNSKLKSSRSRSPVPLADEKTGTLKRTFTFLLSEFNLDSVIVGALKSNKFTLFITCVWLASEPDASKIPSSGKLMTNSSLPSAIPFSGRPKI